MKKTYNMPEENHSSRTDDNTHVRTRGYGSTQQGNSSHDIAELEDVFENPVQPKRKEAINGLVDAGFLSAMEAEAYIRSVIEEENPVKQQSFSVGSIESAKEKVAAARESVNILNRYRRPESPDSCSKCGTDLGEIWTANLEQVPLCLDCAEDAHSELNQ